MKNETEVLNLKIAIENLINEGLKKYLEDMTKLRDDYRDKYLDYSTGEYIDNYLTNLLPIIKQRITYSDSNLKSFNKYLSEIK